MAYKYIFSLIFIFFLSCSEIDRDNILDPKNPSSKTDKVLLLEAFINTSDSLPPSIPYNQYALDAIDLLSMDNDIKDHLIILEYHRDTKDYNDPLEADSFNTESIYNSYISYDPDRFKGVPDLFLNGANARVQGASNVTNVVNRIKDHATDQLLEDGEYTIEVDFDLNNQILEGKYRVARLGKTKSDPNILRMIITYNAGPNGKRTVSRVPNFIPVEAISSGKYFEDDFIINNVPVGKAEELIIILTDETGLNILHAVAKEIL